MNSTRLSEVIRVAQDAVKDLDPDLRKSAFEIILKKLLDQVVNNLDNDDSPNSVKPRKTRVTTVASLAPIPLNLKGGENFPQLSNFYKDKAPENSQEKITVFAYYITKYLSISEILPGHIISCYNELNERKSLNIPQMFSNIKHSKGWIASGDTPGAVKITVAGQNLVEHDLPKTKVTL